MLHIVLGFESHRKDSTVTPLYAGQDSAAALESVESNLSKFGVVRLYKNVTWAKRWIGTAGKPGDVPAEEALIEEPAAEESAAPEVEIEESPSGRKGRK